MPTDVAVFNYARRTDAIVIASHLEYKALVTSFYRQLRHHYSITFRRNVVTPRRYWTLFFFSTVEKLEQYEVECQRRKASYHIKTYLLVVITDFRQIIMRGYFSDFQIRWIIWTRKERFKAALHYDSKSVLSKTSGILQSRLQPLKAINIIFEFWLTIILRCVHSNTTDTPYWSCEKWCLMNCPPPH